MLAEKTPASFVAFDLLALGDDDLTEAAVRRPARRAGARAGRARRRSTSHPATRDPAIARRVVRRSSRGPGWTGSWPSRSTAPISRTSGSCSRSSTSARRTASSPVTACTRAGRTRSVRCCSACTTTAATLASVGVIGAFPMAAARGAVRRAAAAGHDVRGPSLGLGRAPRRAAHSAQATRARRWNAGKDLSFVPLRPERVVEVRYDHMEGERFRHTAQFVRWRPDRDPRSCTYEQLEQPVTFRLDDIVPGLGQRSGR